MVTVQLQHWIQRGSQVIQAIQARAVDCGEAGSSYHGIYSCCELRLSFMPRCWCWYGTMPFFHRLHFAGSPQLTPGMSHRVVVLLYIFRD